VSVSTCHTRAGGASMVVVTLISRTVRSRSIVG
jgi:hypothetical protein